MGLTFFLKMLLYKTQCSTYIYNLKEVWTFSENLTSDVVDLCYIFTTVYLNFDQLFQDGETFFQKKFWLKSLQMYRTLTG